jgi:exodeoxyribonuclease VII large subunit
MSSLDNKPPVYSLSQIAGAVKRAIENATGSRTYWVKSEIATLNVSGAGHAYLELAEQANGQKVAVVKGVIWASKLAELRQKLGSDFQNIVKAGTEFVAECKVDYHVVYGLQLNIQDIDISFNLGEIEKRKRETIKRLKEEGHYERNKQVTEPLIIQNLALIASQQSAAYQDFAKHIKQNEHNYRINFQLFPAIVQGDTAAKSMLDALKQIDPSKFEAVAFIRGGGSKLDLDPFNDYELCKASALMPIPILTGIGHETDLSVLDMIAKSPHKTPTAIADYLIDKILSYEKQMYEFFISIARKTNEVLKVDQLKIGGYMEVLTKYPISYCQRNRGDLHTLTGQLARIATQSIVDQRDSLKTILSEIAVSSKQRVVVIEPNKLNEFRQSLGTYVNHFIRMQSNSLTQLSESVQFLRPENTLARGFSITRHNDKAIKSVSEVRHNDNIEITLLDGTLSATVKSIKSDGIRKPNVREGIQ